MVSVLMSRARYAFRTTATVALIALLAACGSGSSTAGAGGTSGQGTLAIQLTDTPAGVSAVNVDIVGLQIKPSGSPVQMQVPAFQEQTVDLLKLKNTKELMVAAQVPAGRYEYVQIKLDQGGSSVVVDGQTKPLTIPSQEIKVLGGFDVEADGTTTVLLDFNADASLVHTGNGRWELKPVILLANVTKS